MRKLAFQIILVATACLVDGVWGVSATPSPSFQPWTFLGQDMACVDSTTCTVLFSGPNTPPWTEATCMTACETNGVCNSINFNSGGLVCVGRQCASLPPAIVPLTGWRVWQLVRAPSPSVTPTISESSSVSTSPSPGSASSTSSVTRTPSSSPVSASSSSAPSPSTSPIWILAFTGTKAVSSDCPTQGTQTAASLAACQSICDATALCNVVNFSPALSSCNLRSCTNPLSPLLTVDPQYSVFTNQKAGMSSTPTPGVSTAANSFVYVPVPNVVDPWGPSGAYTIAAAVGAAVAACLLCLLTMLLCYLCWRRRERKREAEEEEERREKEKKDERKREKQREQKEKQRELELEEKIKQAPLALAAPLAAALCTKSSAPSYSTEDYSTDDSDDELLEPRTVVTTVTTTTRKRNGEIVESTTGRSSNGVSMDDQRSRSMSQMSQASGAPPLKLAPPPLRSALKKEPSPYRVQRRSTQGASPSTRARRDAPPPPSRGTGLVKGPEEDLLYCKHCDHPVLKAEKSGDEHRHSAKGYRRMSDDSEDESQEQES